MYEFNQSKVCFENDSCSLVEIAETQEEKRKGLMLVDYLPSNSGMFFIFEDEKERNFWMKNVKMP